MTAVDIVLIRRVQDRLDVFGHEHVFYFKMAGSEQGGRATGGGDRIEMVPAILFGSVKKAVIGREVERSVRCQLRKRVVRLLTTLPNLFCASGGCVGDPDRPWHRALRNEQQLLFDTGQAYEGNALSIR